MKITTDNIMVDNNITTYKCPVIGNGTVLLLPSQVKKYLGSYIKHKLTNFGILLSKGYLLDIVSEEDINNSKWLLVIYNKKYYYTPKEYIDTSKIINIDLNINKIPDLNISNKMRAVTLKTKHVTAESINRETLYNLDTYPIIEALTNVELRESPDPTSNVIRTLKKGELCIGQSIWKNNEYNSTWFGTATFTPHGGLYGLFKNNVNVKSIKKSIGYSIIINNTTCKYMNDKYYGDLVRGDLTYVTYQDWKDGLHVNVAKDNITGGLITYKYPAKDAAPLADSSDMINKKYLGELKVKTKATVYEMHRKSNYKSNNDKKLSLDDISVSSLKSASSAIRGIINYGFNDPNSGPAGNLTNAAILNPTDTVVVTNFITMNGKYYYIGFRKTSLKNGAGNYIVLLDGGVDCIDYNPYTSVNTSTNIPTDGNNTYDSVDDVNVNTSKYIENNTNLSDTTKVTNTVNNVYGIHLGVGDTSDYHVPGILQNVPEVNPDYEGWSLLTSAEDYILASEKPFDTKHLTHINRFHLPTGNSGLSTKSFIFVTRPDLNLYHESEVDESINTWAMNPDLKRLACFKYIARLRGTPESPGIGSKIMTSLEYFGTGNSMDTPWLSVFTNQANGYSINDRELDITEMAETFHGNKVIYAEPTFKHKIGGQVQIPFTERRDLTLYFTLRMWIEYIQAVSTGFCSPRSCHRRDGELDYAVSLYYITTDETMENILYWEKLTGLIPLTVPDSFFEWSEGSGAREMKYTITFAYSFRTVMDEMHLAEINNLYKKYKSGDSNPSGMPAIPYTYYNYNFDVKNNQLLSRVAAFYNEITDDESVINAHINNNDALVKYYYGGTTLNPDGSISDIHKVKGSNDGSATEEVVANFLPNYNFHTRMYGIPYVKGPFIEHDPDAQKYKLRWV